MRQEELLFQQKIRETEPTCWVLMRMRLSHEGRPGALFEIARVIPQSAIVIMSPSACLPRKYENFYMTNFAFALSLFVTFAVIFFF
jgi:hypothetical protein